MDWKNEPVFKKGDETYVIRHEAGDDCLDYHVCPKSVDPAGIYDHHEVASFWESLPDDDPRKLFYREPSPPEDTQTQEEKRRDAYTAEADVFRDTAISYREEAEAWSIAGDVVRAQEAEEKRIEALADYLAKKEEIRARYPDPVEELFCLNATGTYHTQDCSYVAVGAEVLTLSQILEQKPAAKACSRCLPAAAPKEPTVE